MTRPVIVGTGALAIVAVLVGIFGAGVAYGAPPFYGQTFGKASERIQSRGQTAVIATVIGSQLATDDCIVTNAYKSRTLNSTGRAAHRGTWLLDLNCNNTVARPGNPGNSVMTPQGQKAKKMQTRADRLNGNAHSALVKGKVPACGKSDSNVQNCQNFCSRWGLCSDELLNYLSSF